MFKEKIRWQEKKMKSKPEELIKRHNREKESHYTDESAITSKKEVRRGVYWEEGGGVKKKRKKCSWKITKGIQSSDARNDKGEPNNP